jgi:hypothetical protein
MLYTWGNGAPVLPSIAKFFSSNGLHLIYTFIVLVGYIVIAGLIISIEKLIIALAGGQKSNIIAKG